MITHPAYYTRLRQAVDTGRVVAVQSTLDEIRSHHLAFRTKAEGISGQEHRTAWGATQQLVDVRGQEDFTVLMYACARYAMFKRQGNARACQQLDTVVAWLMEQGANLMAEGARPIVKIHSRDGRPTFARGRGKNVVEALGQTNLPSSAQRIIDEVNDSKDGADGLQIRRWFEERERQVA